MLKLGKLFLKKAKIILESLDISKQTTDTLRSLNESFPGNSVTDF